MIDLFLTIVGFQSSLDVVSPPQVPDITAYEVLDRAPAAVSVTYTFQCGDDAAALVVMVPQARTQSGVRVSGQSNAVAFLNGVSVGERRNAELQEKIRSIGILPLIYPSCSGGSPRILLEQDDRYGGWSFKEDGEG